MGAQAGWWWMVTVLAWVGVQAEVGVGVVGRQQVEAGIRDEGSQDQGGIWREVSRHAQGAQEAFSRCRRLLHAWWAKRDPETGLLPQNLQSPLWTPENAAADLYPFLVLSARFTDPAMMAELLTVARQEVALTTRLDCLPDTYSLADHHFSRSEVELLPLIFGASEYAKDGLLPMTELLGRGLWLERLQEIVASLFAHAPVETAFGLLPAADTEVNGELLQVLARLFAATGDRRYLEWAERIGDAYCLEVLPASGGLPAHQWDFAGHRAVRDVLSLNDHGNEIIGGLAELFLMVRQADPEKAAAYEPGLRRMFDLLLERARNSDGLWFALLKPSTGEVLNTATPDTWGYALSGVYAFGLATGEEKYRAAAEQALRHLNQPPYHQWEGADAYADSIEGALLLLNRLPVQEGFDWLEVVVPRFLARQQESGIVEGWHGDGNFARTALMLAFYSTQGAFLEDWREDVRLGAVQRNGQLYLQVEAGQDWSGRLCFDTPRHREVMGLKVDYPRLNSFPEWFVVERTKLYQVETIGDGPITGGGETTHRPTGLWLGEELACGLPLTLEAGEMVRLRVAPYLSPPYGVQLLELEGTRTYGTAGPVECPLVVRNRTPMAQVVELASDWGQLRPARVWLPAGGEQEVFLTGALQQERTVAVIAQAALPWLRASLAVRLVFDEHLTAWVDCRGDLYRGETYAWAGPGPIEYLMPARPGQAHQLWLRWGAKNDMRRGKVVVNEQVFAVERGGYDGYEWVVLELPAKLVTGATLTLRIEAEQPVGAPFVSEIRLRTEQ